MDPLSISANPFVVLEHAVRAAHLLNGAIEASAVGNIYYAIDAFGLCNLLKSLQLRVERARSDDPWLYQVQRLGNEGGPLKKLIYMIEPLTKEFQPAGFLEIPLMPRDIRKIRTMVERVKKLVSVALRNDSFVLSEAIDQELANPSNVPKTALEVSLEGADSRPGIQYPVDVTSYDDDNDGDDERPWERGIWLIKDGMRYFMHTTLDTGASVNLISAKQARRAGLKIMPYHETLSTFGGRTIETDGIVEAEFSFSSDQSGKTFTVPFAVIGNLGVNAILRGEFIKEGYLDFQKEVRLYEATERSRRASIDAKTTDLASALIGHNFVEADDSVSSPGSLDSLDSGTLQGSYKSTRQGQAAIRALCDILANDDGLRPLLHLTAENSTLDAHLLRDRFSTLLKKCVQEFRAENEQSPVVGFPEACKFMYSSARRVSTMVCDLYFKSKDSTERQRKLDELQASSKAAGQQAVLNAYLSGNHGGAVDGPNIQPGKDDTGSEASSDTEPVSMTLLEQIMELFRQSGAYATFFESLCRYIDKRIIDWSRLQTHWAKEVKSAAPLELQWAEISDVQFLSEDSQSRLDVIKLNLEKYSGEPWIWWPLEDPRQPLVPEKQRLRWRCDCGQVYSADVSVELASKVKKYLSLEQAHRKNVELPVRANTKGPGQNDVPHNPSPQISSGASKATSLQALASEAEAGPSRSSIRQTPRTSKSPPPPLPLLPPKRPRYVLLCVERGDLKYTQIPLHDSTTDEIFFDAFRAEYRKLRGRLRCWLHPRQFHFCHFSRFIRYDVGSLEWKSNELPPISDTSYTYTPVPPKSPYEHPIPLKYWYKRFHNCICARELSEAVPRLPKRNAPFVMDLHMGFVDMWGLHAELRPSFVHVLVWILALTAPSLGFLVYWMCQHPGDLQTASVPISISVGAIPILLAVFAMSLSGTFKDSGSSAL